MPTIRTGPPPPKFDNSNPWLSRTGSRGAKSDGFHFFWFAPCSAGSDDKQRTASRSMDLPALFGPVRRVTSSRSTVASPNDR